MAQEEAQQLTLFEGTPVVAYAAKQTNTGDGLSQAFETDRTDYHLGDEVYTLTKSIVTQVNHRLTDPASRVAARQVTLRAATITVVTEQFASKKIDAQARKNAELDEEKKGLKGGLSVVSGGGADGDDE